jgi:hypothetical protein
MDQITLGKIVSMREQTPYGILDPNADSATAYFHEYPGQETEA